MESWKMILYSRMHYDQSLAAARALPLRVVRTVCHYVEGFSANRGNDSPSCCNRSIPIAFGNSISVCLLGMTTMMQFVD